MWLFDGSPLSSISWSDHMNDINGDGNNGIATSASLAVCGLPSMSMDNYSLPGSPLLLIDD